MSFVSALTSAVLPVMLVAAVGFALGRLRDVRADALGTVTVYVLSPCLVFHSLATTTLGGGAVLRVAVGVVAVVVVMVGVGEVVSRALGYDPAERGAFVLTASFPNAGNYGIPLSRFAFGAVGQSVAVLYIAVQSVLLYTLGVVLASRGRATDLREAVAHVFRLPLVYAVALAGLVRFLGIVPPTGGSLMRTVGLVGNAAIPVMLLVLGLQLANTTGARSFSRASVPTALKLLVAPAVAVAVAFAVGLTAGDVGRVFVLECAMPAAVTPLVLVMEFSGEGADTASAADAVGTVVLATTLCSVVTVTALLWALRNGLLGL